MKKILFTVAIVAAAALGMTSCSNKEKCWKINCTTSGSSVFGQMEGTYDYYYWGTKNERDAYIDEQKEIADDLGYEFKVNSKKSVKADDSKACVAKNVDIEIDD